MLFIEEAKEQGAVTYHGLSAFARIALCVVAEGDSPAKRCQRATLHYRSYLHEALCLAALGFTTQRNAPSTPRQIDAPDSQYLAFHKSQSSKKFRLSAFHYSLQIDNWMPCFPANLHSTMRTSPSPRRVFSPRKRSATKLYDCIISSRFPETE